jgi:fructose-specific phosphotransferase system IIC component
MASRARTGGAVFRLRSTLTLLYLFAFVVLYCLAIAAPAMLDILRSLPPGPEQEAAAREAVRSAVGPRLLAAVVAAVITTAVAARARILPGLR